MKDDQRAEAKAAFLHAVGWGAAMIAPLAGDASNRRYERLSGGPGGARAVLMDAPPERGEDINRFLGVTAWLRQNGLSAPDMLAADVPAGFALIEDLGDDLYARVCAADPRQEAGVYGAAVDVLVRLAEIPPPEAVDAGLPASAAARIAPYDAPTLLREAMLAPDWWCAGVAGGPISADLSAEYAALIDAACAPVAPVRDVLVLRDYHAENLLWLPWRGGHARVGLLDYQDALAGSACYDLVSLLEDARRDTSADLRAAMLARFQDRAGFTDGEAFLRDYATLGAQRNLKIIGIFARLWIRDGKAAYLDLIPRVWAHLKRDLAHPHLASLAGFIHRHVPSPDKAALAAVRAARQ